MSRCHSISTVKSITFGGSATYTICAILNFYEYNLKINLRSVQAILREIKISHVPWRTANDCSLERLQLSIVLMLLLASVNIFSVLSRRLSTCSSTFPLIFSFSQCSAMNICFYFITMYSSWSHANSRNCFIQTFWIVNYD